VLNLKCIQIAKFKPDLIQETVRYCGISCAVLTRRFVKLVYVLFLTAHSCSEGQKITWFELVEFEIRDAII
jgi:hypothetical protein